MSTPDHCLHFGRTWFTDLSLVSQLEHQYHASNTSYRDFYPVQRTKDHYQIIEAFRGALHQSKSLAALDPTRTVADKSQLLNDFDQGIATQTIQASGDAASANSLIDRFGTLANTEVHQSLDEHSEWCQWVEDETRQRLLSACFMFDVHQAMYHQQCRFKAPTDESRFLVCLPAPDHIWNARNASEWQVRRSDCAIQPLHLIEQNLSTQYFLSASLFTQSLLICWFASNLPPRGDLTYPNDFLPHSVHPSIGNYMALFPDSLHAHTYLALYHTPLHDLLAIAGDTWVFAQKITPPSAFHAAQSRLKTWSTSLAAAQATHHACKILSESLTQTWTLSSDSNTTPCISEYWSIYVSALICWAFGHRYQNSSTGGSGTLSRSNSSTAIGAMEIDETPISDNSQLKALKYANEMLEFSVEELLTSKAAVKCDTTGVIDAVRQRLEFESVGNKSGLLVDTVTVLTKIKEGGRTKDNVRAKWF
jgi:hypothetical protein